ncbi:pseudaminic acid cytidylyltransferase [Helicobacter baculiformis]|uniref:Pseudaminic acid cytidylyltransferase n=1 Tax=Helicobacter baculiformis TaxID=427351 RepID=A0ABV7ZIB5_9HELI|nr:pseudaminic acid cytidylyltransferase [Helicobacter baculiformis]
MLALILARAQSKRIPQKNIYPFLGKPLITHVIETAINSRLFTQVVVSTDSQEIAQIARASGATTPFLRPANLADDFTPTLDVVAHAITTLQLPPTRMVCVLYGTSVLLQVCHIQEAIKALHNNPIYKYALALTPYASSPYRSFALTPEISPLFAQHLNARSQDLPPLYHDTGLFYMGQAKHFSQLEPLLAPHSFPIIVPHLHAQDIDTLEDLELAKLKYQLLRTHAQNPC